MPGPSSKRCCRRSQRVWVTTFPAANGSDRVARALCKMVHNGIEYGDMQLICEAYQLLRDVLGLSNAELYDVFDKWNAGVLQSYLIEITRDIFSVADPEGEGDLVDAILDRAGAKGTGKWMSQLALDLGVPSTLVTTAVFARGLSAAKEARVRASAELSGPSVVAETLPQQADLLKRSGKPSMRRKSAAMRKVLCNCKLRRPHTIGNWLTVTAPYCGGAGALFAPNF